MRIRNLLIIVLVCSIAASAQVRNGRRVPSVPRIGASTPDVNSGTSLPISKVILYSNGVAYIERRGKVTGDVEINLSFKQSQVDDVLKSMLVLDLGQGKIGAVSYNSSLPASARTAEIPFSVDANSTDGGGISRVLSQLQGAKVAVTSTKGTATGSILTVEKRNIPATQNSPAGVTHFLVIASEGGEISSFDLADVRGVKLLDEGTRRDVSEFANATASTRRRDAKTITVTSEGSGQREMVVSYTIAAPIWKTTYRVVLDEQGKPFFQGWAIIDNVSEEDWKDVNLSLISGTPISFIQPIQKPLYRYRPVVPIPDDLNLEPQVYDEEGGGVGYGSGSGSGNGRGSVSESVTVTAGADVQTNSYVTPQQIQSLPLLARDPMRLTVTAPGVSTSYSDSLTSGRSGVEARATGEEIGDLFEYKISQKVTVARDRSALIPIVQTQMDGERVSLYNEANNAQRPMSGMMLVNNTPLTFESGALTVIDRDAYAGESLIERLKPNERRPVSFALDLGTSVSVEKRGDREPAKLVKVVNGVFEVHYFKSEKKIYKMVNQTDRKKVLYVEHPVRVGWALSEASAKPDYTTNRYHRFRIQLEPYSRQEITVSENQGMMDSYSLSTLSSQEITFFFSQRYISSSTVSKMTKLVDLKTRIHMLDGKLAGFDDEKEKIEEDQKRLRENIETLSKTPEAKTLITRYIAKADEQETRLEQMEKERRAIQIQKEELQLQLAREISGFKIE